MITPRNPSARDVWMHPHGAVSAYAAQKATAPIVIPASKEGRSQNEAATIMAIPTGSTRIPMLSNVRKPNADTRSPAVRRPMVKARRGPGFGRAPLTIRTVHWG